MDLRVINILRLGADGGILYHCERPIQQSNFSILRGARLLRNIVERFACRREISALIRAARDLARG